MSRTYSGAPVDQKVTAIFCTPVTRDPRCPDCGREGRYRDTVTRPLTDLPAAGYLLVLGFAVPRYHSVTRVGYHLSNRMYCTLFSFVSREMEWLGARRPLTESRMMWIPGA